MTPSATTAPLVSVIIPCYNGEKYLAEAIQSALDQTYRPIEVIVIDDASTDRSAEIAGAFGPPVRVLRNERNMERSWSRNRGVKESGGELIAFLDADDVWLPDKVRQQVALLETEPDCGLVYGKTRSFSVQGGAKCMGEVFGGPTDGARADRHLVRVNAIPALTVLVRRRSFDAVSGFDCTPWVQACCEDYDLWLRLASRYPIAFLDEVLALYRVHPEQSSVDTRRLAITAARVRWRHVRRHPELLHGKTREGKWLDRFCELEGYLRLAKKRGNRTDVLSIRSLTLCCGSWHVRWLLRFAMAAVRRLTGRHWDPWRAPT